MVCSRGWLVEGHAEDFYLLGYSGVGLRTYTYGGRRRGQGD